MHNEKIRTRRRKRRMRMRRRRRRRRSATRRWTRMHSDQGINDGEEDVQRG